MLVSVSRGNALSLDGGDIKQEVENIKGVEKVSAKIKLRRATEAEWERNNPILADGEPAFITDWGMVVVRDGVTSFNQLMTTSLMQLKPNQNEQYRLLIGKTGLYKDPTKKRLKDINQIYIGDNDLTDDVLIIPRKSFNIAPFKNYWAGVQEESTECLLAMGLNAYGKGTTIQLGGYYSTDSLQRIRLSLGGYSMNGVLNTLQVFEANNMVSQAYVRINYPFAKKDNIYVLNPAEFEQTLGEGGRGFQAIEVEDNRTSIYSRDQEYSVNVENGIISIESGSAYVDDTGVIRPTRGNREFELSKDGISLDKVNSLSFTTKGQKEMEDMITAVVNARVEQILKDKKLI